jgi:tungstate transport system substrate-binding protein
MSRTSKRTRLWRGLALLALALVVVFAIVATTFATGTGRSAGLGAPDNSKLAIYSTTSVRDSGLMKNVVIPAFNAAHPSVTVSAVYVGSGAAIQAARDGLADVIIVHSPADEKQLLADGVATLRLPFAYNYFTIVGPRSDPAHVSTATTAAQAFRRIARWGKTLTGSRVAFVSRGDASGTNKKELQLWNAAGVTTDPAASPVGSWYITAPGGMLPVLQIAADKHAYTLTDTATWLYNRKTLIPNLYRKLNKKADLKNQYSVLLLNQTMNDQVASTNAEWLAAYLVSNRGQAAIAKYGVDPKFGAASVVGEPLFFPNAYTISAKF